VPPARVRLLWLMTLTAVPATVEAIVLRSLHFRMVLSLSPQASAVWPYGALHDLRWVLVYHRSWAGLAGELLLALLVRGLFCAAMVALAWPPEVPRPSFRRLAGRNLVFAPVIAAILAPWAAMAVIASEVSLSGLLLLEVLPVLILTPVLQRGGIVPGWWRGLPPARLIGWSVASFVAPMLGGALVSAAPQWWAVPAAAAAGAANGLLWQRLVRVAVIRERVRWRWLPVAPLGIVLIVGLVTLVDLDPGGPRLLPSRSLVAIEKAPNIDHAVILLEGYDSGYSGRLAGDGSTVVPFSYRGIDAQGWPRPYSPADTHQSVVTSAHLLEEQVSRQHARTGRPVALVGESEGAMIIRYYLNRLRSPVVDTAVLVSPLVRAGRVYYPPPHAHAGWGIGTGWLLRGVFAVKGGFSMVPDSADEPFLRSLLDNAPLYRNELLCPTPGVRMLAFLPLSESIAIPPAPYAQIPLVEVSDFHGMLIDNPAVARRLIDFLDGPDHPDGEPALPRTKPGYAAGRGVAGAWQAPALALGLNPAWRPQATSDASFERSACPR
jgi:hypothetical protein